MRASALPSDISSRHCSSRVFKKTMYHDIWFSERVYVDVTSIFVGSSLLLCDLHTGSMAVHLEGPTQRGQGVCGQYVYWICMPYPLPETVASNGVQTLRSSQESCRTQALRPTADPATAFAFPIEQFGAQETQKTHTRRGKTNVAKMIGKRSNVYAPHHRKTTPAMFFVLRRCCVDVGFLIRKRFFFFKITTSTHLRSLRTCTKVYDLQHFLEVWAVDASPGKQACICSAQGLPAGAACWRGNHFTKQLRANTHRSLPRRLALEPEARA